MQISHHKVNNRNLFPSGLTSRGSSPPLSHRYSQSPSGVALVVVLFAVALVSIVVLVYFNLALVNRNISYSSAGQARANILALSALNYVKGDFIAEIQSGSTQSADPTGANVPIYLPTTNTTMLPYRMTSTISPANYTIPANLIKWSSTNALWPATAAYNSQAGPVRASLDPTTSSPIATTQPSVNGHFIANSLWTKPDFGTSSTFPTTVLPQWVYMTRQGPLTNSSPAIPMATLENSASTNSNYVVGRYAYTVYDEGGLLDVAAAGYSTNSFSGDPTDVGRKGNQGYADLTQLGLTPAQIDTLVGWRNASSWNSVPAYVGYLGTNYPSLTNAPSTGFLQAAPGDQAFVSRQDLIQYWTSEFGASANYLPYLTTFSREKNAPSWEPEHDASTTTSATYWNGSNTDIPYDSVTLNDPSGGISYAYHSNKDNPNPVTSPAVTQAFNRFFPNVRVTTSFKRLSGETAVVGEPLVKNRFDLTKLAWITYNGVLPTNVTAQDVYNYFGLIRNYDSNGVFQSWTYNHTSTTVPTSVNGTLATDTNLIMTLDAVASAGREPDYFELLQATILRGSLGLCSGDPAQENNNSDGGPAGENDAGGEFYRAAITAPTYGQLPIDNGAALYRPINAESLAIPHVVYAQSMFQVIQIGANIIDQYSSDNFPTDFILDGETFYGIKNLPYISAIGDAALRIASGANYDVTSSTDSQINNTATTLDQAYVHRWLNFGLWNPHQNAMDAPASSPTLGPTRIRVCAVHGEEFPYIVNLGNFPTAGVPTSATAAKDYMGCIFEPPGTSAPATTGYITGTSWIGLNLSDYSNHFAVPTAINPATAFTSLSDNAADAASLNINSPDGIITTAPGGKSANGWQRAGIYLGWSKSPDNPYKVPACAAIWPGYTTNSIGTASTVAPFTGMGLPQLEERDASAYFTYPLTIYLQYEDTANPGVWHTYQELHNLYSTRGASTSGDAYMEPADSGWSGWTSKPTGPTVLPATDVTSGYTVSQVVWNNNTTVPSTYNGSYATNMDTYVQNFLDPRSERQNLSTDHLNPTYQSQGTGVNCMVTSSYGSFGDASKGLPTGLHFSDPASIADAGWASFAQTWVDNVSISPTKNYDISIGKTTYYTDRDFIPRVGDAAGWTSASPLPSGTQLQRQSPLQLSRPFRSVAELGYVFRDDPWKNLNLISANSADAGLLDVFYIGSAPSSTSDPNLPPPDVIAGKMNINSAAANAVYAASTLSSPVLQALISQTLRDYLSAATTTGSPTTINSAITTTSDIQGLSTDVLNYMKTNGPIMNIADVPGIFPQVPASTAPTPLYTGLKNPSEALVRSLADSTGTRTWNLMIDVVAQAGKFNPKATGLSNFTVEGEKHYWLHVAIDRFTGEIVDQQLEPVWE